MSEEKTPKEIASIITELVNETVNRIVPLVSTGGRLPSFHCTGARFGCDDYYICDNNNHSCKSDTSFSCGGDFSCTGGPFGIVVLEAKK